MALAGKVDQSQNINTQQLFSCWERFEIIIHQTSNETGDTKIEPAAGSHLSVFYRQKNTPFMSHMHDTEMSRWKTLCAVKTKTSRINVTEWAGGGGVGVDGNGNTPSNHPWFCKFFFFFIKGAKSKKDLFLDFDHARSIRHWLYITFIFLLNYKKVDPFGTFFVSISVANMLPRSLWKGAWCTDTCWFLHWLTLIEPTTF